MWVYCTFPEYMTWLFVKNISFVLFLVSHLFYVLHGILLTWKEVHILFYTFQILASNDFPLVLFDVTYSLSYNPLCIIRCINIKGIWMFWWIFPIGICKYYFSFFLKYVFNWIRILSLTPFSLSLSSLSQNSELGPPCSVDLCIVSWSGFLCWPPFSIKEGFLNFVLDIWWKLLYFCLKAFLFLI